MLDINYIRKNPDLVKKGLKNKRSDIDLDKVLDLDVKKRHLILVIEELREQRNQASKNKNIEQGRKIKESLNKLEPDLKAKEKELNDLMIQIPNMPMDDVPVGKDEDENQVIRSWGEPKKFDFKVRDHVELGELLDIIDIKKAGDVSGARFAYLKNEAVLLQFALLQLVFKTLLDKKVLESIANTVETDYDAKPFIPVVPPVMIKPDVYVRMARLDPTQADERYYLQKDDIYLIGSAEHTLGPLHMDEIISEKDLPIRYVGYSTSFRREAGSYGKDTRGILRMHQFDKIEMESFTTPENSVPEQDFFVGIQEYLMQALNLPYQVMMVCTGDMGGPDARQLDINTWIPSQEKYRETHSADLVTDYQARRLNTRVRREKDQKTELVHMNDATAFAIGRTLIAIIENNQQEDGTVIIPEVLRPFMGGIEKISPKKI